MTVRRLAAATPADRNRAVDLLRVAALGAVVLGHWLKQGWYVDDAGDLHRAGLLGIAPWTHPITWAFQVIPVFFVVGGFANSRSWRSAATRGTSYGSWLAGRMERLTRPLLPLLAFWVLATPIAASVADDRRWLAVASVTSLVPTWFLATYVVVMALTPAWTRLWDRWGGAGLAAGAAAALAVDAASLSLDLGAVGALNLLVVWGTLHHLGIAWSEGWLTRGRAYSVAAAGLAAAVALVAAGPYGVSMVGVSGYGVNNTSPPRATILFLGLFLAGTAIGAERLLRGIAAGPRLWTLVVACGGRLMTVYLWHLTALGLLGAAALGLDGLGLHARPGTREWWLLRPAWLVLLGLATAGIAAAVGRWEDPVWRRTPSGRGATLPVLEVAVTCAGLGVLASEGMTRGAATWVVAAGTLAVLWAIDRALLRPREPGPGQPPDQARSRQRKRRRPAPRTPPATAASASDAQGSTDSPGTAGTWA